MSTFAPTTKADLATAVQAWVQNGSAATTTYGHISTWNVSAITDMSGLCMNKNSFNGDISNWNVSNVTDMSNMFTGVNAFNRGIGIWNVSNVRNMSGMFAGTQYSSMALNAWNVSNVTNMSNMFGGSIRYDQNLRGWSVGPSTILTSMFSGATAMITNQGVSSTPSYTYFNKASTPTYQAITTRAQLDTAITAWIANPVTAAVTYGDINTWDVFTITDMSNLFSGKSTFNSNISGWNVSRVTNMSGMFNGAVAFNQPINSWTVNRVNNMSSMFMNASAFNLNISGWIVGRATLFSDMFSGATAMIANQGAAITPLYTYFTQAPNTLPTGSVTISGTPTQKQVLTISNTLGDLDGLGPFTYQWKRAGTNISGAIGSTYTLVQDDVGFAITVTVSYIDLQGTVESVTSSATATIANANDIATGSVTISGTPIQNQVLTASNTLVDIDGLGPITYQWKRAGSNISGATGSTYTLVQGDVGFAITVTASYTDGFGAAESKTSSATTAVTNGNDSPTGSVTISGTPTQNQVLTASNTLGDPDGLGPITYQWKRGGVAISGATGSTYTLVQGDVGFAITVTASYTDLQGTAESITSSATAVVANTNDIATGSVTISGTPTQNQVLTVSNTLGDLDGLGPFTYQWKRAGSNISGATGSTYTLVQDDVGFAITVTASYTDLLGSAESVTSSATTAVTNGNDSPTGSVTISGTPTQNQVLTASNTLGDLDGLGPITYQWKRAGSNISGATGSTYTLVQGDVGFAITVTASYTDLQGTAESITSSATATVANVNDIATGSVTISGTPTQNQVLTVSNTLGDLDGLGPFTYQWKRAGSNISGATGSTYTLVQGDVGFAITVTASYTDLLGSAESVTSSATALVAMPVIYVFTSKTQLQTAVDAWCSNSITATGVYGVINTWDVSTITDMSNLFQFKPTFNSNINGWNVSNVTNMAGMFFVATTFNQPLNSWDVSKVTSMAIMFSGASAFNQNIRIWSVGQSTYLANMFNNATAMIANQGAITTPLYTYFTPANTPPAGSLTITGTPTQNQVLTANTSGISDVNGLGVFSYQWKRAGSNIPGATGSTYTLVQGDVGFAITVTASYTDLQGTAESITSSATAVVANTNDIATGSVTISGTPMQNQVLTVSHTLGDLDGLGPITYQWKRAGSNILGATSSTYALVLDDVGKYITVTASYTDLLGNAESVTSGSTAAVAVFVPLPTATRAQLQTAITSWISNPTSSNIYGPINTWDVSAITDMSYLFNYKSTFNSNISSWNVSNVTNMQGMFQGATAFNQPLNAWNMSQVVMMSKMFNYASSFNQPLNDWIVSNAVHMGEMFSRATSFDQSIGGWNVSKVVDMNNMFLGATAFNQPLDSWNVIQLTNASNMFCAATKFNQPLTSWNVSNVIEMGAMFSGATAFDQPLNSWNVSKVKNMTNMFMNNAIFNQSLSSWIVSQVTTMQNMFNGAAAFNQPLNSWNLRQVNNLSGMFAGATSFDQPLNSWNVSNVNNMSNMFLNTPIFNRNIRGWYVGQSTLLTGMFSGATAMLASQGASATPLYTYFDQAIQYTPPTGGVLITGIAEQGQLLTVSNTFVDADGVGTVYYQWIRDGSAIFEAINSTWTLAEADVGKQITVTATYVDGLGKTKRSTSAPTAQVVNLNDVPNGDVTISGTPAHNQTLTASHTLTDADGPELLTVNWQWNSSGIAINGATGSTYALTQAEVGKPITVTASYTDGHGTAESKTSVATAPVAFAFTSRSQLDAAVTAWYSGNTVTYGDINTWDVSAITDMSNLFYGKSTFNSDISSWNVSQVTNMGSMFYGTTSFNQPLSSWNVSQVTNMGSMFYGTTSFNQPLSSWNVSQVTNMTNMFYGASAFNQPLNSWNVSRVGDMWNMFNRASAFNQPLNSWNVSAVRDMSGMFLFAPAFDQPLNSWNVSNVTNMGSMFLGATAFNQPLSSWDVNQVIDMISMFYDASAFNQNIRTWSVGQSTNLDNMFSGATAMINNQGASATPTTAYMNTAPTPPAPTPTGPALEPVAFVLTQLNASYELSQALSIIGDYTAPAPYALPTITLSMPASQFNDGLFQLALVDSNINTLVNPATEAVYFSEKITYYANQEKLPELKNSANVLLKDLPVINGAALKPLRQRVTGVDGLGASMIHELAYQLIGVSLMDDQIANGASLKASIDAYLTTALPAFVRLQLANCNGKTQNIAGASDLTTRANVSRELFMQIVESVVGGVSPVTGNAKSSRLNSLFDGSNLVGGKYGIKFIAGDTLRFSITIAPYSVGGVVQDVDYIVDGVQHVKQEARTVELVITMV